MPTLITVLKYLEQVNTVLGIGLNVLLLYAIKRFSGPQLGNYKYLLTVFTSVDVFLIILHVIMHPRVLAVGSTYGIVTDTVLDDERITSLYTAFQSVPFTLLGIHFLYRYWSVRHPHLIDLFSNKKFVFLLVSGAMGMLIAWYYLCLGGSTDKDNVEARNLLIEEYERKYGKRIENAWLVFVHWRDNKFQVTLFVTTFIENIIMIFSLFFASTLAFLTFYHIHQSHKISIQANQLQKKLLIALCAQAFIPSITVYIPYVFCINIPFFGVPTNLIHDLSVPLTTCFPVWDAAVMILLISDYRRGLVGMIRKNQVQVESTVIVTTTSAGANSDISR